ncbi:MAG: hypothetical protein CVV13_06660 [Gammaproteobacteria bacterium HGW-Gammaproteobacteria-3]|jgi:lipoprotein signal peptidase|nr:MAG: hypothetical protein CVV13_06660 [Gammaproteobacteria bacterium HGW-Gammaproteobacteria-3]
MIGTITALIIAFWFYKNAEATGKNPLSSAAVGFLAYLIPCIAWTIMLTPSLRNTVEHNPGTLFALFANYAYILAGIASAVWVKFKYFKQPES